MKPSTSLILLASIAASGCAQSPEEKALPNIVFILADDLGYGDLSRYGQQKFSTPNAELLAKEDYMKIFRGKFDPEKPFKGVDGGPEFRLGPYGSQPKSHAAFAAMIKELDDYVGEILSRLKELGLEKNTIVIFASDNGPHLEGGIRTPLLVKWSGKIKAGSTSYLVSAFWDIMPTLAEITGAQTPENIDGISFLPTLLGKRNQKHYETGTYALGGFPICI